MSRYEWYEGKYDGLLFQEEERVVVPGLIVITNTVGRHCVVCGGSKCILVLSK